MKWARIENGKVKETTSIDPAGRFHPSFIWVECNPDTEEGDVFDDGEFEKPDGLQETDEAIKARKVALVQSYMDAAARELRYDSISTAISYAEEPTVPKFQEEGKAFRAWRSLVWEKCYQILSEVETGTRKIPSDDELIKALPKLQLPDGE